MVYSVAWDETTPAGSEVKSLGDNRIRELKAQIRERLTTEHSTITGTGGLTELIHLPGKTSVLHYGTTTSINALTGMSQGAIAFDTTLGCFKAYNSSAWTILPFDWDAFWGAGDPVHTHASDAEGGVLSYSGHSVQVVNTQTGAVATGSTAMVVDDTIPQITEGDEYMTLAITPKSATNKLKIDVVIHLANDNSSSYHLVAALFQDTTAGALAVSQTVKTGSYGNNMIHQIKFTHYMTSGTTSETTFRVRAGSTVGTTTFNGASGARLYGGVIASSITITEISV